MASVRVRLADRSYGIHVGQGIIDHAGDLVASVCRGRTAAVITNPTIGNLYATSLVESLKKAGISAQVITIPAGERFKSLSTVRRVYDELLNLRIDRSGIVIGLGGGVVGDLAGFVAATYLRGVDFVQVPTSLLAQVDASVGGKVGVNLPRGKNLVGAFYQPKIVVIDTATLSTLPRREFRCGLAEVIKHGIILDSDYFSLIENQLPAIRMLEPAILAQVVEGSCRIKAVVVERDERESGLRAILNYGHTVGHALESVTKYRLYRHGEAVAIGMVTAGLVGKIMGVASESLVMRVADLIRRAGLPVKPKESIRPEALLEAMRVDKKVLGGRSRFVLVRAIGDAFVSDQVTPDTVLAALQEQMGI